MKINSLYERLVIKIRSLMYKIFHPKLWGKECMLNGIPKITSINNLKMGRRCSLNEKIYLQCVSGIDLGNDVTISYGATVLTMGLDTADYINNAKKKEKDHKGGGC